MQNKIKCYEVENEKEIVFQKEINPAVCPHYIFMPSHYREDGTCECDNPNASYMKDWGYRWSKKHNQWR